MNVGDVVQFIEGHKWIGCLGIIYEIKNDRYMVGVPVPQQGTAYIFAKENEIERIGEAKLILKDKEEEKREE